MEEKAYYRGFWQEGTPFIWLSAMAVLTLIGMVVGVVALIFAKGSTHFWPAEMALYQLKEKKSVLGIIIDREGDGAQAQEGQRILVKVANRDVYGLDFKWIDGKDIASEEYPPDAVVIERDEYGDLHGFVTGLKAGGKVHQDGGEDFFQFLRKTLDRVDEAKEEKRELEEYIFKTRAPAASLEKEIRTLDYGARAGTPEVKMKISRLEEEKDAVIKALAPKLEGPRKELAALQEEIQSHALVVKLATGQEKKLPLENIVRLYRPNSMGLWQKTAHYLDKVFEFLFAWPRESNTEGGVFPAIFGTVMMVLIMTVITTPLGVLTALYLHEYAKPGLALNMVRLAVSNLAGVPSIVFGIFGLGFFIYFVGGGIDRMFFADKLPAPTFGTGGILWASLTLALLTVPVVVVAAEEGLSSVPKANRDGALALGATKFQMIWNVVLPNAMPGILTGVILAVARGAGEVAPLMITGVVKLASSLPVDAEFPFFHLDRKFMHLGFHIYDVGFQSPNVEAAKPMVYTTTFLLLVIVIVLNALAIMLRNRLRRKYRGSAI